MPHTSPSTQNHPKTSLFIWLMGTCFLIWLMIMLGGATRLTRSGLSIVEWKPLVGIIPPLTEMAWLAEFDKYKQFPEYQLVNFGMTLSEFKFIFFMEYAHRLLGRLIGLFFGLPLVYFWVRGYLTRSLKKRMILVLLLGLAQGFMGWYMVKSGLTKDPSVSHYRLTGHLFLALILLGVLFWTALDYWKAERNQIDRDNISPISLSPIRKSTLILVHLSALLMALTILYGGFVAGLKAGKIYNTYPLMGGQFLPSEWNFMSPLMMNFLENPATVQWVHRTLAILTLCFILGAMGRLLGERGIRSSTRKGAFLMMILISGQVALGIATLLFEVPVSLGTLHQGMGVLVLTTMLYVMFCLGQDRRRLVCSESI